MRQTFSLVLIFLCLQIKTCNTSCIKSLMLCILLTRLHFGYTPKWKTESWSWSWDLSEAATKKCYTKTGVLKYSSTENWTPSQVFFQSFCPLVRYIKHLFVRTSLGDCFCNQSITFRVCILCSFRNLQDHSTW